MLYEVEYKDKKTGGKQMGSNKGYSEEFKQNIVELNRKGKNVSELVSEYGVSKTTINIWIKERSPIKSGSEDLGITGLELKAMQRRIKEIEEENEILKKVITIFAKK